MRRPQLALNCSCGDAMRATVSPVSKLPALAEVFLAVHDGPAHRVTDHTGAVVPPPAAHEVARAGASMLPGMDEVPERPADGRRPSWTA